MNTADDGLMSVKVLRVIKQVLLQLAKGRSEPPADLQSRGGQNVEFPLIERDILY